MKKQFVIFLALMVLLTAGCAKSEPETVETTAEPTTVPTETTVPPTQPVPETEDAVILADKVPAVLALLSRGDTVDVVGEYDESYYAIKTELGYGLVEKQLLAMPEDAIYEIWTGYSRWNRNVYDNFDLTGTPIQVLKTNTKVEVLDELENCYVIKTEEFTGFMKQEDLSKGPIRSQSSGGGGGYGGGGGGADGGDISLSVRGGIVFLSAIAQEGDVTGQATVKADGTPVILGFFDREDLAKIVVEPGFAEEWEGYHTVLMDDLYAHVSKAMLRQKTEEAYAQWDGYAKYNTMLHDNFRLRGEGKRLSTNTQLRVIADLGSCYLVEAGEETGYIAKEFASESRIVSRSSPSGGGGGGGGGQEWSDPVM